MLVYSLALIVALIPAVIIGNDVGNRFADWLSSRLGK